MPIENKKSLLNNELTFLIACCQIDPSEDDIEFIYSYLSGTVYHNNEVTTHLSYISTLASAHGILPLVYKTLKKVLQNSSSLNSQHLTLNTALLNELKVHYQSIAQRNMLMSAELIRIMKLLEKNDIEALAFKGPTLAQMAYENITLRQYSDLDILIQKKDVYKTSELLINHNFNLSIDLKYLQNSALLDLSKDIDLYNQDNNLLLELHWNLFENNLALNLVDTNIWNDYTHIKINNYNIKTLPTDFLLLYLCIHGSKHMWERIEWIVDIDRIIRAHPTINWIEIIKSAKELRSLNMLLLGLSLSSDFFSTKIPESIKIELRENSIIKELSKTTKDFLNISKETSVNTSFKRFEYYNLLQGKPSSKLKQLCHALFDISKEDFMAVKLPRNLKLFYYLIRPIRLIYQYSFIWKKSK